MPTYCRKCLKCQHPFETYAKLSESALIRCPLCGGPVATDIQAQGAPRTPGMIPLADRAQVLHEEGWRPEEVPEIRRMLGPDLADCVKDTGDVVVQDTRTAKRYFERKAKLKQIGAEKYAEKNQGAS